MLHASSFSGLKRWQDSSRSQIAADRGVGLLFTLNIGFGEHSLRLGSKRAASFFFCSILPYDRPAAACKRRYAMLNPCITTQAWLSLIPKDKLPTATGGLKGSRLGDSSIWFTMPFLLLADSNCWWKAYITHSSTRSAKHYSAGCVAHYWRCRSLLPKACYGPCLANSMSAALRKSCTHFSLNLSATSAICKAMGKSHHWNNHSRNHRALWQENNIAM